MVKNPDFGVKNLPRARARAEISHFLGVHFLTPFFGKIPEFCTLNEIRFGPKKGPQMEAFSFGIEDLFWNGFLGPGFGSIFFGFFRKNDPFLAKKWSFLG